MTSPAAPPHAAGDGAQPRRGLVLLAMTGSLSMIFIDMTVVGVALPRIGASLGMDDVGQAWIVTSYLLALASLMAVGGRVGDLVGKVPAFVAGVVAFAAASAVCAFARDGTQMIAGRVLQGVAACLMQPASGALVIGAFAPGERGKAMAAYVGIPMVFMALGPAVGGVIVEGWGWKWVFLMLGLPPLVFGIQQLGAARADGSLRWDDPLTLAALAGGSVALAAFVRRQWNHPRPLLRLRLFADHALAADAVVIMCMQFAMTGLVVAGSLYAQDVLGYSPTEAGASLLPMLAPVILVVHVAGRWYDRAGVRAPATWGTAMASGGMLVQAMGAWAQSYPVMAVGMFVLGLGIAFTMSPTNTDALGRVPHSERGQVSGLVQTMRQVGGSVGVATVAAAVAISMAAFTRAERLEDPASVARLRAMLRSGDANARVHASSDADFPAVQRASARAYAVGYGVAALGTASALFAVRRWMRPGKPVT
jgi:MFS family permease